MDMETLIQVLVVVLLIILIYRSYSNYIMQKRITDVIVALVEGAKKEGFTFGGAQLVNSTYKTPYEKKVDREMFQPRSYRAVVKNYENPKLQQAMDGF
jgi:Tfp pilus assembly protein PilE